MNHVSTFSTEASDHALLCFSHLRWDFVYQRPQHLIARAARESQVWFLEEPIFEGIRTPELRMRNAEPGVIVAVPVLPEGEPEDRVNQRLGFLLRDLLSAIRSKSVTFWYYTPLALAFSRDLHADLRVYDNMDELSAFKGASPLTIALEDELLERADVVFTGGQSLYEAKRGRHHNIHAFPSSIDAGHFNRARQRDGGQIPEYAGLARPRLGFFGVIDERMDLGLLAEIAGLRPGWSFVMIGPVVKIDPATLPSRENIIWLGRKSYHELPAYMSGWDIGIMPFAINDATRFISPTKTPEYLAAGLPVISTPVRDVVRPYGVEGLVEIAASPEAFVAKAEEILANPRQAWLDDVDRFLSTRSWDKTWAAMRAILARTAAAKGSRNQAPQEHARV